MKNPILLTTEFRNNSTTGSDLSGIGTFKFKDEEVKAHFDSALDFMKVVDMINSSYENITRSVVESLNSDLKELMRNR